MKSKNTTPKLISKREFNRRKVALQEKHAWLIKDNSFDIRPGWIHLLDNTLTKIKSSLNKEDIEESRLVFLYTGTRFKLQIFVEGVKLSPRRLKLIDHLIDSAALDSELTCPKCGHVYISRVNRPHFPRQLKSLKLEKLRRIHEQATTLYRRVQTSSRQASH